MLNSVTTQWMMVEQVEPDSFEPLHHKLKQNVEAKHEALLKEYVSQFAQDEMSIWNNTSRNLWACITKKPYPIVMKYYQWVHDENIKGTYSKGQMRKQVQLVSPHH